MRRLAILPFLVCFAASVQGQGVQIPFPLVPSGNFNDPAHTLVMDQALLQLQEGLDRVTLIGCPLPRVDGAIAGVNLELERLVVASSGARLVVDGQPVPGSGARVLEQGVHLWSGTVRGESDSEAFLALSFHGSRGWIRRGTEVTHLLAEPDPVVGWARPRSRFVRGDDPTLAGIVPAWDCLTDTSGAALPVPQVGPSSGPAGRGGTAATVFEDFIISSTLDICDVTNESPQRTDASQGSGFSWGGYTNATASGSRARVKLQSADRLNFPGEDGSDATASANYQGSFAYTIFDSTGGSVGDQTVDLRWVQLGVNRAASGQQIRLLVRDAAGAWFLSQNAFPVTGSSSVFVDLDAGVTWLRVDAAAEAEMNELDADAKVPMADPSGLPASAVDLSSITGGGVYVEQGDTDPNNRDHFRLSDMTWIDRQPPVLLETLVAFETDYQFYQLFNDLNATRVYAVSLIGAVSNRYVEQTSIIMTAPYLGLYSNSNDPWFNPESGGNSVNMLYEFQAAWGGQPFPGNAHLAHFLSGANLGGGVAWLPGACDNDYGFAVSGNIGGDTPFPVSQGPLTWDFMVVAHELGHNMGTPHTHDFCPPLDECAPSGYFGSCQTRQQCTSSGTIMSYCHLCSGGMSNITTFFHPSAALVIRQFAETSCIQPYQTPSYGCGVNPAGSLVLESGAPVIGGTLVLGLDNPLGTQGIGSLPVLALALAPDGNGPPCGTQIPGLGMAGPGAPGELLISIIPPNPVLWFQGGSWSGPGSPAPVTIPIPLQAGLAGVTIYAQGALWDPSFTFGVGIGLTEAISFTIGP